MKTLTETQLKQMGELFDDELIKSPGKYYEGFNSIDKTTFLRLAPQILQIVEQPVSEPQQPKEVRSAEEMAVNHANKMYPEPYFRKREEVWQKCYADYKAGYADAVHEYANQFKEQPISDYDLVSKPEFKSAGKFKLVKEVSDEVLRKELINFIKWGGLKYTYPDIIVDKFLNERKEEGKI